MIGEAIRANPAANIVDQLLRDLAPEPIPIPVSLSPTPQATVVTEPVQLAPEQRAGSPLLLGALWLLLAMILPLLIAILFVILLCVRGATKSLMRFLLAQLVLLGSQLVVLFIIFSISPWLLENMSQWTVAIMVIVLLLEEAALLLFVIMQSCEKHYVLHQISVEDFDPWKAAFDELRPELKDAGSIADFVFRNMDDPNQITVLSEVANHKKARAFVSADEPRTTMEHSGAKGPLDANLLEDTDRPSVCCKKEPRPTYVLGQISVDDFDLWKAAFDDLRSTLKTAGSKGEFVFRNADNPNQITVMSEIDSLEKARAFVAADALPKAVQHSGAQGHVHVYLLEDSDTSSL